MKKVNIIGQTFGQLYVISEAESRMCGKRKTRFVSVLCDCGTEKEVRVGDITTGKTTSCGCHRKKVTGNRVRTHGGTGTRLYKTWKNMRNRCSDEKNKYYHCYGGRGISVCPEWEDFTVFRDWAMSNGYCIDLTIDRENNDDNYHPDNCRWATWVQQARNRRPRSK